MPLDDRRAVAFEATRRAADRVNREMHDGTNPPRGRLFDLDTLAPKPLDHRGEGRSKDIRRGTGFLADRIEAVKHLHEDTIHFTGALDLAPWAGRPTAPSATPGTAAAPSAATTGGSACWHGTD